MKTVIENVNQLIDIKNELRGILLAVGKSPSDSFEEYAEMFDSALEEIISKTDLILGV